MNVLEELAEVSRRTILVTLLQGPKNVSELVEVTGMKQPNVSNHLGRLRARGYVRTSKIGRQVYYSIGSLEHEESIRSFLNYSNDNLEEIDLHSLAKDFAKAAVRGSEPICQDFLDQALRAKQTLLEIYEQLLAPAMSIVGTWYGVEAIDEGQEHMASEITLRMMARTSNYYGSIKKNGLVAVLGCAPNNRHVIGLRMVGDLLQFSGWDVIYTGPDTPYESFMKAVRSHSPDLVLLSCATEKGVQETVTLLNLLAEERGTPAKFILGVGGTAVQEDLGLFQDAGANFTASSLRSFAELSLPEIERVGKENRAWDTASLNGFHTKKDKPKSE